MRAYAPASIGNFAAGFDLMGAALAPLDGSLLGGRRGGGARRRALAHRLRPLRRRSSRRTRWQNLVLRTYALFREELRGRGIEVPAIAFHLEKNLPRCSGLGSSAASVAATLAACQALLGDPLSAAEVWTLAGRGRGAGLRLAAPGQRRPLPRRRPPAPGAGPRRRPRRPRRCPGRRIWCWWWSRRTSSCRPSTAGRPSPARFDLARDRRLRRQPGGLPPRPGHRRPRPAPPLPARSAGRAPPRAAGAGLPRRPGRGAGGRRLGVHALRTRDRRSSPWPSRRARPRGGRRPPGRPARRRPRLDRPPLRPRPPGQPGCIAMRLISTRDAATTATFRAGGPGGDRPGRRPLAPRSPPPLRRLAGAAGSRLGPALRGR